VAESDSVASCLSLFSHHSNFLSNFHLHFL
jgi:hypothetical protein